MQGGFILMKNKLDWKKKYLNKRPGVYTWVYSNKYTVRRADVFRDGVSIEDSIPSGSYLCSVFSFLSFFSTVSIAPIECLKVNFSWSKYWIFNLFLQSCLQYAVDLNWLVCFEVNLLFMLDRILVIILWEHGRHSVLKCLKLF